MFGEWLRQQRKLRGFAREQFSNRVGCSVSALRKIEDSQRKPSVQIAKLIANCLDIPQAERATFVRVARRAGRVDVALWSAGPSADQTVSEWARRLGTSAGVQPEGDLGVKLSTAFAEGLQRYERVVVIGSDAPTLPIDLIVAAFDFLDNAPIVLGPANDGGYYAVGATRRVRPRFDGVRWSSPSALEDTIAANAPHRVAVTPPWYDVDDPTDLAILRVHLSVDPGAAPATARFLGGASLKDRAS